MCKAGKADKAIILLAFNLAGFAGIYYMHAIGYLILALARMLGLIISIYTFVIAAAVLISWVNADPYNPIVRVIRSLTEPAFNLFRRVVPERFYRTGFDFTPVVVLLALILIETILVNLLFDIGRGMLMK